MVLCQGCGMGREGGGGQDNVEQMGRRWKGSSGGTRGIRKC